MDVPDSPFLCFEVGSSEHRQLAMDYWSGNDVGSGFKWASSLEELSRIHAVAKKDLLRCVKLAVTAHNLARRCVDCHLPEELSSRTAFTVRTYRDHLCSVCTRNRDQARLLRQEEQTRQRVAAQSAHIAEISQSNKDFRYDTISYTDAVIAFSIMLASDEACESGTFKNSDDLPLCAGTSLSGKLLSRLFVHGVLGIEDVTQPEAFVLDDNNEWTCFPNRITWRFARDVEGRTFPEIMAYLAKLIDGRDLNPDYDESVMELWKMLAFDDALDYLSREVDTYRLPDVRVGPKTEQAIWHALEHYSIPQVRRVIAYVVKNAAALSQRRDFVRRHALNTVPGSLISYVDRAVSEGWPVHPVLRSWQNEEPVLLTVLFNRVFGTGLPGFRTLSNSGLTSLSLEF